MTTVHYVETPEFWWDAKKKDFTTHDTEEAVHCKVELFQKSINQLIKENPNKRIFVHETIDTVEGGYEHMKTSAVIMDDKALLDDTTIRVSIGHPSASPLPHDQRIIYRDCSESINEPSLVFRLPGQANPVIVLKDNGDIFVHGKLIENDKEVVQGMRNFLNLARD